MTDYTNLIKNRIPINEEEAKKEDYKKFGDPVKQYQLKSHAKFDYSFVEPIARMKAAGLPDDFIAYTLNVHISTLNEWKNRYPQVFTAYHEGKDIATKQLVAKLFRCASGYDYEERNEKWVEDVEGNRTGKKNISVFHKHQPPSPNALFFALCNLDSENWKSKHKIDIDEKRNITIKLDGKIVSEQIEKLAGKLIDNTKVIESKDITDVKD